MKKIKNKEQLVELYNDTSKIIFADSKQSTKKFIEDSQNEWKEIGQEYKEMRESLNISIKKISELLGCSEGKIRKFEKGEPIQAANLLKKSYAMALEIEQLKQEDESYDNTETIAFRWKNGVTVNVKLKEHEHLNTAIVEALTKLDSVGISTGKSLGYVSWEKGSCSFNGEELSIIR